jgi:hypothetical protein
MTIIFVQLSSHGNVPVMIIPSTISAIAMCKSLSVWSPSRQIKFDLKSWRVLCCLLCNCFTLYSLMCTFWRFIRNLKFIKIRNFYLAWYLKINQIISSLLSFLSFNQKLSLKILKQIKAKICNKIVFRREKLYPRFRTHSAIDIFL